MMFVQQWPPLGPVMQSIAVLASTKCGCGTVNHMQIFFTENIPGYVEYADVQRVAGKWRYMGTARQITTA
jgi:hypothetical protein